MSIDSPEQGPCLRVPKENGPIEAPTRHRAPACRDRQYGDGTSVSLHGVFRLPCLRIPHNHRPVFTSGGKKMPARRECHHVHPVSVRLQWASMIHFLSHPPRHSADAGSCSVWLRLSTQPRSRCPRASSSPPNHSRSPRICRPVTLLLYDGCFAAGPGNLPRPTAPSQSPPQQKGLAQHPPHPGLPPQAFLLPPSLDGADHRPGKRVHSHEQEMLSVQTL